MFHVPALIVLGLLAVEPPLPVWTPTGKGPDSRLRGVHALDPRTVWASGSNGTFLKTTDGGKTWTDGVMTADVPLDFRDVHAFDARNVVLLSSGPDSSSRIYRTEDGGKTWALRYPDRNRSRFLDAIAFWDAENGLALGDPEDGRFVILATGDGGKTWARQDRAAPGPSSGDGTSGPQAPRDGMPLALPGEGAFAASGTCLVARGRDRAWFATGSAGVARVFRTADRGRTWAVSDTPLSAGNASSGAFSLAFRDDLHGVAVGGDYANPDARGILAARTTDGGRTWKAAARGPRGYRSAVAYVPGADPPTLIAVGPTGSDYSADDGKTWGKLGETGFHALSVTGPTDAAWAVGDGGTVARLRGTIR